MANFTRRAIKETFLALLEERPFSDITVKDIVEKCGINRNSFYYHYQDLPALLEEIVREDTEAIIRKYPNVSSIVECYDALTEFVTTRRRAIMHIYRSVNREMFETYLMQVSEYFVRSYVDTTLVNQEIPQEDRQTIIILPNVEMYANFVAADGDNPAYFNVAVTPLENSEGAEIFILSETVGA